MNSSTSKQLTAALTCILAAVLLFANLLLLPTACSDKQVQQQITCTATSLHPTHQMFSTSDTDDFSDLLLATRPEISLLSSIDLPILPIFPITCHITKALYSIPLSRPPPGLHFS